MICGDKTSDSPQEVSDGHLCWGCGYEMKGLAIEFDGHSHLWLFVEPCPECGLHQPNEEPYGG